MTDRLSRANLQYQYGLLSAYKNQHDTACDYMALAAAQEQRQAYQWLKHLSEKYIYAQSKMIYLFESEKAHQADTKVIFDYYYLAIRRGEPRFSAVLAHANKIDIAKHLLATCYAFGYGVGKDYVKAYELYNQASSIPACYYNKLVMLYLGLGVSKDKLSAIYFLERNHSLFGEYAKLFSSLIRLKKPLLIDFNSDQKDFDRNLSEIYKLGIGFTLLAGLLYFYDGLGFIISIIIVYWFFVVRLVRVGVSSKLRKMLVSAHIGIWYDPSTNLTWMRCSLGQTWNGRTCVGTAQKYTWEEAQQAVAEMNRNGGYAGYTDWMVPDTKALQSLLRKHKHVPKIDHTIFPNTPGSFYWSASPYVGDSGYAWIVGFNLGGTGYDYKSNNSYVRAVRAGQ